MPPAASPHALRGLGKLLTRLAPIEPHEVPPVVAAFCLFFCVLGGYFAVRPVRETVGTILGKHEVKNLFAATWAVSVAIIPIYGYCVARFRRSLFMPWIYGLIAAAFFIVGIVFQADERSLAAGRFFYVFISVLNLFVVSVFWSFLLEVFNSAQTKRLFGVIAAGGTAGALAGPLMTDLAAARIGNSGVLFLGAGAFIAAIVFQRMLIAIWAATSHPTATAAAGGASVDGKVRGERAIGGNPFAGFTLLLKSPYLLSITLFVVLLATISTFLYFEQLRLVEAAYPDITDRTRIFARLDWIVQSLTVLCQIFLTGRIAGRLGLTVLAMIVPVGMIFGFAALAATGTFTVLAVVFVLRRAGEYAFVRPAREMLFGRLDNETKYKAKNVIDVPVYRGADALTAQVKTAIESAGMGPGPIAIIGAGLAAAWALNAWYLGRKYDAGRDG